jgi:hypothetical protein
LDKDGLDNIDAVLISGIGMFKEPEAVPEPAQKRLMCLSLFHCVKFLRQLLSAFSTSLDENIAGTIIAEFVKE